MARRFQHVERAIDVRSEIGLGLLDRRHDVGPGGEMEYPARARTGAHHGRLVRDVTVDDLQAGISLVLPQVAAASNPEAVEHPNHLALRDQAVDQMAADEAPTSCDEVQSHYCPQFARTIIDAAPRSMRRPILALSPPLSSYRFSQHSGATRGGIARMPLHG